MLKKAENIETIFRINQYMILNLKRTKNGKNYY